MLTLSRNKLTTFLACQRRFQLRYRQRLPWPEAPAAVEQAAALARGQQFHQLLQQQFLDLPSEVVEQNAAADLALAEWWDRFRRHAPVLPAGRRLPEISLTVPAGAHLLYGRFDLLILADDRAHIYDWKTGQRPSDTTLRDDWQTRLYLALLAQGSPALDGRRRTPEQINLTYWFATAPDRPITFQYSAAEHARNWGEIEATVAAIDARLAGGGEWPLTDDLAECRRCAYQVICGRQAAGRAPLSHVEEPEDEAIGDVGVGLEPALPG